MCFGILYEYLKGTWKRNLPLAGYFSYLDHYCQPKKSCAGIINIGTKRINSCLFNPTTFCVQMLQSGSSEKTFSEGGRAFRRGCRAEPLKGQRRKDSKKSLWLCAIFKKVFTRPTGGVRVRLYRVLCWALDWEQPREDMALTWMLQ